MTNPHVQKAIDIAGGQSALGKRCGRKQQTVFYWLHAPKLSAEAAVLIDKATSGEVSKELIRPDLFAIAQPVREPLEI